MIILRYLIFLASLLFLLADFSISKPNSIGRNFKNISLHLKHHEPVRNKSIVVTELNNTQISGEKTLRFPIISKSQKKIYNKSKPKKYIAQSISVPIGQDNIEWHCPIITTSRSLECGCDLPHTLRCSGDIHGLTELAQNLRNSPYMVSFLDCSLKNVTVLNDALFENVSLHGLVISSGEIKLVHKKAFLGLKDPLKTLGLPNNALEIVPWNSIAQQQSLERLDLSNNNIKTISGKDFANLRNLVFLDLSDNLISNISPRSFTNQLNLDILKLSGNRLGIFKASLLSISQCYNLRQLDLSSNFISGHLNLTSLSALKNLNLLNFGRNLIKSVQNKSLESFSKLLTLYLDHNQIDVLQDHAFFGLSSLETLDLSYNGIVAISSASLQHLLRLKTLDLTHNFLRALTSDLMSPLPSLTTLRLSGNDISIVSKNSMDGAKNLINLIMNDNPLSCDCSIRFFAEWLGSSKTLSKDLLSATCATPPRLEGAPLIEVQTSSLNCEQNDILDDSNVMDKTSSVEQIILKEFQYSTDHGLTLTWKLSLGVGDHLCNEIFVYKFENSHEILIDNPAIHCESKIVNGKCTVTIILPNNMLLTEDQRYCLAIMHEELTTARSIIGCSNITTENLKNSNVTSHIRQFNRKHQAEKLPQMISTPNQFVLLNGNRTSMNDNYLDTFNKHLITGLGLGVLVAGIIILFWGATKLRLSSQNINSLSRTCYTADQVYKDPEIGSYLKLQATSTF